MPPSSDMAKERAAGDFAQYFSNITELAQIDYPERQPWLQEDGTKYKPVWTKTRKPLSQCPRVYRCAYIPAVLWEMESSAVKYGEQFCFETKGRDVLVKVKLSGPGIKKKLCSTFLVSRKPILLPAMFDDDEELSVSRLITDFEILIPS
jgi:hypothetical protein